MQQNRINFAVDGITAIVALGLAATGLLLHFVLPRGSGRWQMLWGLKRHEWGELHFWFSIGIMLLVLLHVALHWSWICTTVLCLCKGGGTAAPRTGRLRRHLVGAGLLVLTIVLFTGFIWMARTSVRETSHQGVVVQAQDDATEGNQGGKPSHEDDPGTIRGSMTLAEAATFASIPVSTLRERLGLPSGTPADEKLGRICRSKGISMTEARKLIAAHK